MNKLFIMKVNNIKRWTLPLAVISILAIAISSCTKYDDPAAIFEEYGDRIEHVQRKVLLISIDGAVGAEVEKAIPRNIAEMLKTSKYTWTGLSEATTTDATTWKSMVTGVSSSKHMVLEESDDFMATPDINDPHSIPQLYPSVFYRMMEARAQDQTVIITPWPELANRLMIEVDTRIVADNDAAVRDAALKQLNEEDPELMIVNFRSVIDAGVASGFTIENSAYLGAINRVDEHIGEIMEALKARKKYDKEEWLVIVTSNHGGTGDSYGGESLDERNIFSIFHNPDFLPTELSADYINSARLHGKPGDGSMVRAQATDPSGLYNPGSSSITIEAKVKFNKRADGSYNYIYPPFLSKTAGRSGATPGWSFFKTANGAAFWVANGSASAETQATFGNDGLWHTITGVIERVADGVNVKFYVDGSLNDEKKIESTGDINTSAPLVMGYWPHIFFDDNEIDMSIADLRIWDEALSDEQIKENACLLEITDDNPSFSSLIGNWPAQDGGSTFANLIPGNPTFNLEGDYKYNVSSASLPCDLDDSAVLIQNVDIVPQIFYWLKIEPKADWSLDGTVFLDRFEIEFIKQQDVNLQ